MTGVREIIVVEGKYDKNAVCQAVSATVIETDGFRVFSDGERVALISRLAQSRGVILMTDGDGAGFFIRSRLKGMLRGVSVKHAYIPDIPGREKRKSAPSKQGLLGVEGMTREVIIDALRRAGATFTDEAEPRDTGEPVTKYDMYECGLTGAPDSADRRKTLSRHLSLPGRMTANALLAAVNILMTRGEFFEVAEKLGFAPDARGQ